MNLPSAIRTYFEADGKPDGTAPMNAFAIDAVVEDEGNTYRGCEAIEAWWRSAKVKTQHTAQPIALMEKGEVTEVRATVSGNFPGSPAELTFAFRLSDGEKTIARLEIGA